MEKGAVTGGTGPAELARVRRELAARAADATRVSDLALTSRDLTRVLPLLEEVLERVADLLDANKAALWVADPSRQELYPVAWFGLPDGYIGPMRVPYGRGSSGRAVVERAAVLILDVETSRDYGAFREGALQNSVRSAYSTPMLTTNGEPMGAIAVYFDQPTTPVDRNRQLVETYARQAAEIVERGQLYAEARELANLERRRGRQFRSLADAAMALSAADELDDLLRIVTEAGREVVGTHQGVTSRLPHGWDDALTYVSLSDLYAEWRDYEQVPKGLGLLAAVVRENKPLRLTGDQLAKHPSWRGLGDALGHPPLPDLLAAPLVGRDGRNLGTVQLSHKIDGSAFTEQDEAIIVQLAQMTSASIERLEAFEGERRARRSAEAAARTYSLLSAASATFAGSLDADELVRALVAMVVPRLADWAVLHLLDQDGEDVRLGHLQHRDPTQVDALTRFFQTFPIALDEPYGAGAVLATGVYQLFSELPDEIIQSLAKDEEQLAELRRIALPSGLVVPLIAHGRTFGALTMLREQPYFEADVAYALDLVSRAALALDNASRYAFERELAGGLQRSLLPRSLPTSALLTSASRYLPGARGTKIGGDWYDLIEVDGGDLVLVVGDVMGRGVQAAAVMGQLRATVRAYALEGHGPAEVLQRLDQVVLAIDELHFTTCVVGRLDPRTRELCIASAGHLPPLVVGAAGGGRFLELDPGLPLGVGGATFVEQCVQLGPGETVLLYTDGLVEDPRTGVGPGMDLLLAAVARPVQSAEEVCDRVLAACGREGGDDDDDTALLALLLGEPATGVDPEPLLLDLPAVPESAPVVRHALRELLGVAGDGEVGDTAELLVTELVANAARHAGGEVRVRAVLQSGLLLVEVLDSSEVLPIPGPEVDWDCESGRGIALVEALADRWGADPLPSGKRVWFELSLRPL